MQTVQTIAQVLLFIFVVALILIRIGDRKRFETKFDFVFNLGASIILLIWLFFAGSFDKFLSF